MLLWGLVITGRLIQTRCTSRARAADMGTITRKLLLPTTSRDHQERDLGHTLAAKSRRKDGTGMAHCQCLERLVLT